MTDAGTERDGVVTYPVDVRDDGVYVGFAAPTAHERTVADVMAETLTEWGDDAPKTTSRSDFLEGPRPQDLRVHLPREGEDGRAVHVGVPPAR